MYKRLLILLSIASLLFSAEIRKTYFFDVPSIRDGKIILNNCHTAESQWAPSVAVHAVQLVLPKDEKVISCAVEYDTPALLKGVYYIKPSVPPSPKSHGPLLKEKSLHNAFFKDAYFPTITPGYVDYNIQYKNGIGILSTTLYPSQYNPISQRIRYHRSITLTIKTALGAITPNYYCTPANKSSIKTFVENPEAVDQLPLSPSGTEDYEYMIVCKSAFENSFNDFIAFNERRGLRTQVFTVDYVNTLTGNDFQDKLRNLIKKEYNEKRIKYVLLASNNVRNDVTCIPHRGFYAKFYDHDVNANNVQEDNNIPADMYYGCLDGDWKTDNNGTEREYGYWETEDVPAEVYVGRFCVGTTDQLENCINKTIKYSEQPVTNNAIKNVMLAGEFLWDDYGVVCTGSKSLANLKGDCDLHGFSTCGFPTNVWNIIEVRHEDHPDWQERQQDCKTLFYDGIQNNKCAWVDHNGHSSTEFSVGSVTHRGSAFYMMACMGVLSDDIWADCNGTTSNYFFFTSGGCYNAAFDNFCPPGTGLPYSYSAQDCWAAMVTRLSTGPVAMIGNSRFGMGDNDGTDGPSDRPIRWIHDAIFNPQKKIHYVGHMLSNAKESDITRITLSDIPNHDITQDNPYWGALKYTNYELNLFGDPALSLWTDTPQELTPNVPGLSGATFTWESGLPWAWLALVDNSDNIIYALQADKDGKFVIDNNNNQALVDYLASNPASNISTVRIKAHNYLPYEGPFNATGVNNTGKVALLAHSFVHNGKIIKLSYTLSEKGLIQISLYDSKGALIRSVVNKYQDAGQYQEAVNSNGLSNGIYYCRMSTNSNTLIHKIIIAE